MSGLTQDFLEKIGVELDQSTFDALSYHFDTTLYSNIIGRISKTLDSEKKEELERISHTDKEHAWDWLLENVPDLELIIQEEVYMLLGDVIENADHI